MRFGENSGGGIPVKKPKQNNMISVIQGIKDAVNYTMRLLHELGKSGLQKNLTKIFIEF